jgi:ABC-type Fe3+-hydroxamate transport system substrate-binding protein
MSPRGRLARTDLTAAAALAGCSGPSAPGGAQAPWADAAFQVTITHAFGEVAIPAPPQRVSRSA